MTKSYKDLTDEEKVERLDSQYGQRMAYNKKRNAKRNILCRKAIELGLDKKITDQEIDEEIHKKVTGKEISKKINKIVDEVEETDEEDK